MIVSAHYDTAPTGAGAIDNAGGTAMVQCLAEWLAAETAAGRRPRRTVRFVVYSGHETGLHGPRALVRDRPELLDETVFALNFDVVGQPIHLNARLRDRGAVGDRRGARDGRRAGLRLAGRARPSSRTTPSASPAAACRGSTSGRG